MSKKATGGAGGYHGVVGSLRGLALDFFARFPLSDEETTEKPICQMSARFGQLERSLP
jgi:hypothetical protein